MLKLAGHILDVQDDATLSLLRRGMSDEQIREKFAAGEQLGPSESGSLEDSEFAAIFFKDASVVRRAYPVGTAGQTMMSAAYFHKVAGESASPFPEAVRNQIACNLVAHCDLFGIQADPEMRKWAGQHGEFIPNDNWLDISMYDSPSAPGPTEWAIKRASPGGDMLLFPCSSKELVEQSLARFPEFVLDPMEERIGAAKLCEKAAEFGVDVPDGIRAIGSVEKRAAQEVHGLLLDRLDRVPVELIELGSNRERLKTAISQIEAETDPIKQAGAIAAFDAAVGFGDGHYSSGLPRPFEVVFQGGEARADVPSAEKIGAERVREYLGDEAMAAFERDPDGMIAGLDPLVKEAIENV